MKQTILGLMTGVAMMAPILVTPALAAGTGTVTSVVHNTLGAVHSVLGGSGASAGGGSASVNGGVSTPAGGLNISTGASFGGLGGSLPSGPNGGGTDGFYLGAQSDGNGFVSLQITKTLFRF